MKKDHMRVLWVVNVKTEDLSVFLGDSSLHGGGWITGSLNSLKQYCSDIQIGIVIPEPRKNIEHHVVNQIDYYLIPYRSKRKIDRKSETCFRKVYESFAPDLIHIHGTEYPHSLSAIASSGNIPCVVSIQGLLTAYLPFCLGGISFVSLLSHTTIRDILKFNLPTQIVHSMTKRSYLEKKVLSLTKHVIGRTDWDHAQALAINPTLNYHSCNETLKDIFYTSKTWSYSTCVKHSIFASNSSVPLKGIHILIMAAALVKKEYPDVHLDIAGEDFLHNRTFKSFIRTTGYGNYLRKLILRLGLQDNVTFLGLLSSEQMRDQLLRSNVYVLPSAIENSPNTLCEAQILGTPVISAEVGGVLSLIRHKTDGLVYRFEDTVQLSYWIKMIFSDSDLAAKLGSEGRKSALIRHDRANNALNTANIYKSIRKDSVL